MQPDSSFPSPPPSTRSLHIFISTGEVSGDLQGALLIEALQRQAKRAGIELQISALGGDRMAATGATVLANTSAIGSIGLVESLPYVRSTLKIQRQVKPFLRSNPPDVLVMIDYIGPNVGVGQFVRKALPDTKTVYYIAPQEWVWSLNQKNTNLILNISDRLLAIFPAEAKYYEQRGGNVTWIGHPLIDRMAQAPSRTTARQQLGIAPDELAIALIPASRKQELKYILPVMVEAAQQLQAAFPAATFWIPLSLEKYRVAIEQAIDQSKLKARLIANQTDTVLAAADLALTKSGTVNLELALLNVPQVVLYRLNPVTAWLAKHVLRFSIPFAAPPNLVMMRSIVPEFLQENATSDRIVQAALELLQHPEQRQAMQADYQVMRQALGAEGVCDRAAQEILQLAC